MPEAAPIPTRRLGRASLSVTVLGFGAAPLGDLYAKLDEAAAVATVEAALAGGVRLIDTSPLYGHGLSEHRVGAALRRSSARGVVVSTKVGRVTEPFAGRGDGSGYLGGLPHALRFDYSHDGAMRSLEQSALRLGVDAIDIALIHDVDVWTHGADAIEARFAEAMEGAYRALERLRAAGAVKAIGVGVNEAEMCERFARAGDFDTMLMAGRYSLLEQPALAAFMPLALEKGYRAVMLGGGVQFRHPRDGAGSGREIQLQAGAARGHGSCRRDRGCLRPSCRTPQACRAPVSARASGGREPRHGRGVAG